jgi:hypothetical protein
MMLHRVATGRHQQLAGYIFESQKLPCSFRFAARIDRGVPILIRRSRGAGAV